MSLTLIVDDTDSGIAYEGNWTLGSTVGAIDPSAGTSSNEYNSTVHASVTSGDKLVYSFEGTSISLYGTLDKPSELGIPNAYFTLDDLPTETFNRTGNIIPDSYDIISSHMPFYQSPTLTPGPHTLTVTVAEPSKAGASFIVDFFTIGVGADVSTGNVIVDDSDPRVVYNGPWVTGGSTSEYLRTTHGSPSTGGGGASFSFYGTGVAVYATISSPLPDIDFSVDGNITSFTGPIGTGLGKNTVIFQAEGFAPSQNHTLKMAISGANGLYLDYIVYRASPVPLSLATLTPAPTTLVSPGISSSPTTPPAAIPVASSNEAAGPNVASSLSPQIIAAIVVGVIVGLVVFASILFGLVLWQRKRRQWAVEDVQAMSVTEFTISPFISTAQPTLLGKLATSGKRGRESGGGYVLGGHEGPVLNAGAASTLTTGDRTRGPYVSRPSREVDGGVRLASGYAHSEVLPPSYARYGQD